jgi:endonuclease I
MKQLYILFLFLSSVALAQLTPPTNLQSYYSGVDFNKTGINLFNDLATEIIASHSNFISYTNRHNYLYDADEDPSNISNVILIYSGESRNEKEYESGNNTYLPQTFNTEHVYPRSLLDNSNAEGDLHLLRVCDISINSSRGNNPFIAGTGIYKTTGSAFYPGDDWRGDVARIIMYVNLRYNEPFTDVGTLNLFMEWNVADPVSALEDQRNTVISSVQGNRNPFIDNPYLATIIWGGTAAQNRWSTLSSSKIPDLDFKIYPNPISDNILYIQSYSTNKITTIEIYNLLGSLVFKQNLNPNSNQINVSNLNKGIYLIKLNSEKGSFTKKMVKQ